MPGSWRLRAGAAALGTAAALTTGQVAAQEIDIGPDDVGGVVTSSDGPEAGVWVIAETFELGVRRHAKIVVTDDQGRYLIPDLEEHTPYHVWVRGYGLIDSDQVNAELGQRLDLTAIRAPDERRRPHSTTRAPTGGR